MNSPSRSCALAAALAAACLCPRAEALINPNFTPAHMVREADAIMWVSLTAGSGGSDLRAEILDVMKGRPLSSNGVATVTLAGMPEDEVKEAADPVARSPGLKGMLFLGAAGGGEAKGYLHFGGLWLELAHDGKRIRAKTTRTELQTTWAGGTDMLRRAVAYALAERDADFPVVPGARWAAQGKDGVVTGRVFSATVVRAGGGGLPFLHVAADSGDRLFRCPEGGSALEDVTAEAGLRAKSVAAAWADLDGDGRADLVSWDGAKLTIHRAADKGGYLPAPVEAGFGPGGCLGLAVMDSGKPDRPALLASTPAGPVALVPSQGEAYAATQLPAPDGGMPPGGPAPCLALDLDGDGWCDVLCMFPKSSLFYRGTGPCSFAKPVALDIGCGEEGRPFAGDFDHDGKFDIFCPAKDGCRLWQNLGGLAFEESLAASGEAAYKCDTGGIGGMTCDFNNDGRQDLAVFFDGIGPQLFFNRGFRSFGHGLDLCPTVQNMDAEDAGQQAGCVADLNGDGLQDMALVLKRGEVMTFFQSPEDASSVAASVAVAPDGGRVGPVSVSGWAGGRSLGVWLVAGAGCGAHFGMPDPGPLRLRWSFPGGGTHEKEWELTRALGVAVGP